MHATIDTVFDWQYEIKKKNLLNLYEKGKALQWNASDIPWDTEVDLERMAQDRIDNGMAKVMNELGDPPKPLTDEMMSEFTLHNNAFMLSQFLHGE